MHALAMAMAAGMFFAWSCCCDDKKHRMAAVAATAFFVLSCIGAYDKDQKRNENKQIFAEIKCLIGETDGIKVVPK